MFKPKILIAGDEPREHENLSNYLKLKNYQPIFAKGGYEAIYLFDKEAPQMVLLNWNVSGISGLEVCQNFKKKKKHIPIIVFSDQADYDAQHSKFMSVCDEFVLKPYNIKQLDGHIQTLFKSSKEAFKDNLVYGDLVVDRQAHRVTRSGKSVELSSTEYQLLEYLLENIDTMLTRKAILEHVWGTTDPQTFTNIVDVYMNYLRKKIDIPGRRSMIKTVRGYGYMIEDLHKKMAA